MSTSDDLLDVVFVVRPGQHNEELRYSLRSVAENLSHNRVWIVGGCPRWVSDEVGWIETPQAEHKHRNVRENIRAACRSEHVTDRFILMNDDFFILQPTRRVEPLHRGTLDEFITQMAHTGGGQLSWHRRAIETRRTLEMLGLDPAGLLSYELHVPMVIDRQTVLDSIADLERIGRTEMRHSMFRTRYGNLAGIGGRPVKDVKISTNQAWERAGGAQVVRTWRYVSTQDETFNYGPAGAFLRNRFRTPSKYEREV